MVGSGMRLLNVGKHVRPEKWNTLDSPKPCAALETRNAPRG